MLIRQISSEKLIVHNKAARMQEDINASAGYARKAPVVISSTSMCDLPESVVKKLRIPILPFKIRTDEGIFKDGVQMDSDELLRHINLGKTAVSTPPDVATYTEFFASVLKNTHHLIHISITSAMSDDYKIASEAAKAFDNVTVVNSTVLSSASGILVLIAYKLTQMNLSAEAIVEELEAVKHRLKCSFVINTTEYMARKGLVSSAVNKVADALSLRPCLSFNNDKYGIGGVWMGSRTRAYRKYIHRSFPGDVIPDSDILFITYVDIPEETLMFIKDEVSKLAFFEKVVFMKASAAISSNCGPGTFGVLYFVKGNKSYNLASLFSDLKEESNEENEDETSDPLSYGPDDLLDGSGADGASPENGKEAPWYMQIEGINGEAAIQNSGSEDAFKTVLKIFYDSIPVKSSELNNFFESQDWVDYTIKVHALKSSSRLIGALELGEKAQNLENAGKEGNKSYIEKNHPEFMKDYLKYSELLSGIFEEEQDNSEEAGDDKPVADEYLMQSVYEGLHDAAEAMDIDTVEEIVKELEDYSIPQSEKKKYSALCECIGNFDYDGILRILDEGNK